MTSSVGAAAGAAAGLAASNDAMQGIISAANNGSFRVTPDAGNELIRIFENFEDELRNMDSDLDALTRRTPLGDSPAGQAIAEFNKQVAAGGDGRSYQEMIKQMQERMPQVIEAIKKGIRAYQEVDEGNAAGFGGRA
jgi:DNA-binding ferritin-like protein